MLRRISGLSKDAKEKRKVLKDTIKLSHRSIGR